MKGLVFTFLLTYGGLVASLYHPFIGLLIYISFAIIKPDIMWSFSVPIGNYSRFVAIGMLLGWLIQGLGNWQFGRTKWIVLSFLGFWVWGTISTVLVATNQDLGWLFVTEMGKIFMPFLVGMTVIETVRQIRMLAWVLVISQAYVAYELNFSYFVDGINKAHEAGFGSLDNNGVALTMVTGSGLAFFMGLQATQTWQKLMAFLATFLMVHVVMLSFSRGGMLSLCLMAIMVFWLIPKYPKHCAVFALAIVLGFRLAGPEVRQRFLTIFVEPEERDDAAQSRVELSRDGWDVMLRFPVFGVGPGHWAHIAPEYGWPEGKAMHSLWFQTGAELGIPGLSFLVLFYLLCLVGLWRMKGTDEIEELAETALVRQMVITSIIGFAISAQFLSAFGIEIPYYVVLLGAAYMKVHDAAIRDRFPDPWRAA